MAYGPRQDVALSQNLESRTPFHWLIIMFTPLFEWPFRVSAVKKGRDH